MIRPHLSLNVRATKASVDFYRKVFGTDPQKQTEDYAKFDLTAPPLNLSLVSSTGAVSRVNHLGIEVDSAEEVARWEAHLRGQGLIEQVEQNVDCCYARQDKVWFTDPDGNRWEVFTVHEQLPVTGSLVTASCCRPTDATTTDPRPCGCA